MNSAGQPAFFVNVPRMPHAGFARNFMCLALRRGNSCPPGAWIEVRWECRIGAACHCDSFVCHLFVCKTSHCVGIHRSVLYFARPGLRDELLSEPQGASRGLCIRSVPAASALPLTKRQF